MTVILTFISVLLMLIVCGLSATVGYFIARKLPREPTHPPAPELNDEEKLKLEKETKRFKREYENFLKYDGSEQG